MKKNYPDSKNDMFATFIEKCQKLTIANGYYALITQPSILFLNYFENLRKKIPCEAIGKYLEEVRENNLDKKYTKEKKLFQKIQ